MRIHPDLTNCTAFLGVLQEGRHKSPYDQDVNYYGTGFFVTVPTQYKSALTYFITAKHLLDLIVGRRDAFLRVNRRDGLADYIFIEEGRWHFHPEDVHNDVAAIVAPIDYGRLVTTTVEPRLFAKEEDTRNQNIGLGDSVHVIGLFSVHRGQQQNAPVVRSGTVAMLPTDDVLIGPDKRPVRAYLIEATSAGGMSGAPVFVEIDHADGRNIGNTNKMSLLGMLHGHWDLPATAIVARETTIEVPQNAGISIVIPAHRILEVLSQQPVLDEQKELFEAAETANARRLDDANG